MGKPIYVSNIGYQYEDQLMCNRCGNDIKERHYESFASEDSNKCILVVESIWSHPIGIAYGAEVIKKGLVVMGNLGKCANSGSGAPCCEWYRTGTGVELSKNARELLNQYENKCRTHHQRFKIQT